MISFFPSQEAKNLKPKTQEHQTKTENKIGCLSTNLKTKLHNFHVL
jgi:hypothetical protein